MSPASQPQRVLGHYHVLERVGAGGMGEVFRALDSNLGREVALKMLPATLAGDPERIARFKREAQLFQEVTSGVHGKVRQD